MGKSLSKRQGGARSRWWQRNVSFLGGALMLGMGFMGCSSVPASSPDANSAPEPAQSPATQLSAQVQSGQSLPVSAQIKVADQVIQLEVAKTLNQQAIGLMARPKLEPNRGMLFPFNPARPVSFWMKNVLINLDMVFLRNGRVVAIASEVPPCQTEPCPVYGPKDAIDQVIELRGGRAEELGIKPGDRLTVQSL